MKSRIVAEAGKLLARLTQSSGEAMPDAITSEEDFRTEPLDVSVPNDSAPNDFSDHGSVEGDGMRLAQRATAALH
jgi:hypothetical protein